MADSDERWMGLVRNVMLGREGLHRHVLLDLVNSAGGSKARSYLTTGNVTFSAPSLALNNVVAGAEATLAEILGRREPLVVRPLEWLRGLVARDPFAAYEGWRNEVALLPL